MHLYQVIHGPEHCAFKTFQYVADMLFSPERILLTGSSNLKEGDLISSGAFYKRKVDRNCMRHHNGIHTLLDL
jgi:hypothetical protein